MGSRAVTTKLSYLTISLYFLRHNPHLRFQIMDFILYFNRTMAKPFNWKYTGEKTTIKLTDYFC